jgi:YfiH family protein
MILPAPDASFEWRQTAFGPALVCTPLDAVAPHFFTTRPWRLGQTRQGATGAWDDIATAAGVPASSLHRLMQVHGRDVVIAERHSDRAAGAPPPEADIVVSGDAARVLAVQGADCVPLLIADRRLGVVAAAHAGWRGLALGVPNATVAALVETYGSHPRDLIAAIGPSVGACCYEVGSDVVDAFQRAGSVDAARWFAATPASAPENPSMPGVRPAARPGHAFFDGWACARAHLLDAGLDEASIFTARLCTASHPDLLCSYRRDGVAAGRIAGVIRAR